MSRGGPERIELLRRPAIHRLRLGVAPGAVGDVAGDRRLGGVELRVAATHPHQLGAGQTQVGLGLADRRHRREGEGLGQVGVDLCTEGIHPAAFAGLGGLAQQSDRTIPLALARRQHAQAQEHLRAIASVVDVFDECAHLLGRATAALVVALDSEIGRLRQQVLDRLLDRRVEHGLRHRGQLEVAAAVRAVGELCDQVGIPEDRRMVDGPLHAATGVGVPAREAVVTRACGGCIDDPSGEPLARRRASAGKRGHARFDLRAHPRYLAQRALASWLGKRSRLELGPGALESSGQRGRVPLRAVLGRRPSEGVAGRPGHQCAHDERQPSPSSSTRALDRVDESGDIRVAIVLVLGESARQDRAQPPGSADANELRATRAWGGALGGDPVDRNGDVAWAQRLDQNNAQCVLVRSRCRATVELFGRHVP